MGKYNNDYDFDVLSAVAGILNGHARRWNKQHRGKSREELYRKQKKFLLTPLPRGIWVVTKNGTTLQHRKPRQIHCHLHITKSDDVMRVSSPREKKKEWLLIIDPSKVFSTFDWHQLAKTRQHGLMKIALKPIKIPSLKVSCWKLTKVKLLKVMQSTDVCVSGGGNFFSPTIQTSVRFRDFVEKYYFRSLWTYHLF